MTEKEKILRGMLYAPAHDETLLAELAACKAQCQQFNQRAYQAEGIESAQMLLRRLLAREDVHPLDPADVETVCMAASLHDIGKLMIPRELLEKPDRLTPEEYEILRKLYLEKYTYEELAREMGLKKSALAMRVKRSKERFVKQWNRH